MGYLFLGNGIYLPLALSEHFPIAIPMLRCNVIEQKWLVTGLGFLPITFTKHWVCFSRVSAQA